MSVDRIPSPTVAPPGQREERHLFFFLLLSQVPLLLLAAYLHAARTNTIAANGHWLASKATLERGVMGTLHFLNTPTSLAQGRLQLGSWHGYQEVLYHETVDARQVAFDFALDTDAYLLFLFQKTQAGFCALRLSSNEQFPSAFIVAAPDGEFTTQTALHCGSALRRGRVEIRFETNGVAARLDGQHLGTFARPGTQPSYLGFRGGEQSSWVDNVELHPAGSVTPTLETFFNTKGWGRAVALAGPGLLLITLLASWSLGRHGVPVRERFFIVLSATAVLTCVVAGLTLAHELVFVHAHPAGDPEEEERFRTQETQWIRAEIRQRHPRRPPPGVTRILFVGTSQTWGAGATREANTFVRQLERRLNDGQERSSYECINAGIMALTAPRLLKVYEDEWLALDPDLVVVHLSNNDLDELAFEQALVTFARLAKERQIPTVFSLEANSIEHTPQDLPLHHVMRRVAEREGLPVVDVHGALRDRADDGLLWWDFVHPTDYGHRLIANVLWPVVAEQVGHSEGAARAVEREEAPSPFRALRKER